MKRKCMILKDQAGALCGCLIQEADRLICSCRGQLDGDGELVCIGLSGRERTLTVNLRKEETVWPQDGEEVEMAYITKDGELVCATGEHAALRFRTGKPARIDERKKLLPGEQVQPGMGRQSSAQTEDWCMGSEARWPPPPCMLGARYHCGRWRQGDDEDS